MIAGDVTNCIELAVLEAQKEWLSKRGVEYTVQDLDDFIDDRFNADRMGE